MSIYLPVDIVECNGEGDNGNRNPKSEEYVEKEPLETLQPLVTRGSEISEREPEVKIDGSHPAEGG